MKHWIIVLFTISILSGCRTIHDVQYIERISYQDKIKIDSVYVSKSDSVFIHQRGDTVFFEKYRTLYKTKYRIEKDTVLKHDSLFFKQVTVEKVQVEKKLSTLKNFIYQFGIYSLLMSIFTILFYIGKNYMKIKNYLSNLLKFKK